MSWVAAGLWAMQAYISQCGLTCLTPASISVVQDKNLTWRQVSFIPLLASVFVETRKIHK